MSFKTYLSLCPLDFEIGSVVTFFLLSGPVSILFPIESGVTWREYNAYTNWKNLFFALWRLRRRPVRPIWNPSKEEFHSVSCRGGSWRCSLLSPVVCFLFSLLYCVYFLIALPLIDYYTFDFCVYSVYLFHGRTVEK